MFAKHLLNVLLLSWNDDNLGVAREIRALQRVFGKLYGYNTDSWLIPSDDPGWALCDKVHDSTGLLCRLQCLPFSEFRQFQYRMISAQEFIKFNRGTRVLSGTVPGGSYIRRFLASEPRWG
jgi:hypothetical protein